MKHLVGARVILAAAALAVLAVGCVVEAGAPPEPTDPQGQGTAKTSSAVVVPGSKPVAVPKGAVVLPPSLKAAGEDEGPRPHPWTPPTTDDGEGNDEGPRPHPWTPPSNNSTDNVNVGGTDGSGTTGKPSK